jgi:hypothetical protein
MSELLPFVGVFAVWALVAVILEFHAHRLHRKTRESERWRRYFVNEEIRQQRR